MHNKSPYTKDEIIKKIDYIVKGVNSKFTQLNNAKMKLELLTRWANSFNTFEKTEILDKIEEAKVKLCIN